MYNGRYNEQHDFIALEIVDSNIQFSFSLGSGVTKAVASIPDGVSDGHWHSVVVSYFNKVLIDILNNFLNIFTFLLNKFSDCYSIYR